MTASGAGGVKIGSAAWKGDTQIVACEAQTDIVPPHCVGRPCKANIRQSSSRGRVRPDPILIGGHDGKRMD